MLLKRAFSTASQQIHIKHINDVLPLAMQHLSGSMTESLRMPNPDYLSTNFLHKGWQTRPQYSCGYSKEFDIISIYFLHSDPTYNDAVTDLNIKHQQIELNDDQRIVNVHCGFLNYLIDEKNEFMKNIHLELKTLQNKYKYDVSDNTRLLLIGDSLGAALSQLFYILVYTNYCKESLSDLIPSSLSDVYVITFGSPSFMFHEDVTEYFRNERRELNERIFNFHNENDPIPMLLTGNGGLQTKKVSFREVVKCSTDRKLEIASNYHLGHNFWVRDNDCINMEQDEEIKDRYLLNGARNLWMDKGLNMRQMLTMFAKNHWPHHYKHRLQKALNTLQQL